MPEKKSKKKTPAFVEPVDAAVVFTEDSIAKVFERARQMEAGIVQLRRFALKRTKACNWKKFGDGSLHMEAKAAEQIATILGINWPRKNEFGHTILDWEKETLPNGHFKYTFTGEFWWQGRRITAQGHCQSDKPWYISDGKGGKLSPEDISESNVQQHAFSNLIVNGVRRVTGLHDVTIEDLEAVGVKVEQVSGVNFTNTKEELSSTSKTMVKVMGKIMIVMWNGEKVKMQNYLQDKTKFNDYEGFKTLSKFKTNKQVKVVYGKVLQDLYACLRGLTGKLTKKGEEQNKILVEVTALEVNGETFPGANRYSDLTADQMMEAYSRLEVMINEMAEANKENKK